MTIVFFSNFINHHQKLVADELDRLTGYQYTFVEVMPIPEWITNSGYPDYSQSVSYTHLTLPTICSV